MPDGNDTGRVLNLLDELGLLPDADAAKELRVSVRTFKRWRTIGKGPPTTYVSRVPLTRVASLRKWIIDKEKPGSTPEPARRGRGRPRKLVDLAAE